MSDFDSKKFDKLNAEFDAINAELDRRTAVELKAQKLMTAGQYKEANELLTKLKGERAW